MLPATVLKRRLRAPSVALEQCGVMIRFGNSWNGRREPRRLGSSAVGYCHQTSIAAPPILPSLSAANTASSSKMPARPILIRNAVGARRIEVVAEHRKVVHALYAHPPSPLEDMTIF